MCGNGRSVKTRHQKWSSETGGRHDASMAEFRTRRPRHICETSRCRAVFERSSYVSRWRRTGWLGISDSNCQIRPRATQLDLRDNFAGGRRKSGGGDFAYELRGVLWAGIHK